MFSVELSTPQNASSSYWQLCASYSVCADVKSAEWLLAGVVAGRKHDHLIGLAGFFRAQGLFQRDFVKGVDAHLDAIGFNAAAVAFHANADVIVHDALDSDQYLHGKSLLITCFGSLGRWRLRASPSL